MRQDSRKGCSRYAPVEGEDKKKIQHNIHDGRDSQKNKRNPGISNRAEKTGEIVIEKSGRNPRKNDNQIVPHQAGDRSGNTKEPDNAVNAEKNSKIENNSNGSDEKERLKNSSLHATLILFAETDGKGSAASHTQAQDDGSKKGHQSVRRAYRSQSIGAEEAADDNRVGNIVKLLEQIPGNHGKCEKQQTFCNISG